MACDECDRRDLDFIGVRSRRAALYQQGKLTTEIEENLDSEENAKIWAILTHRATHDTGHVFE
jgi:hypothetical protein